MFKNRTVQSVPSFMIIAIASQVALIYLFTATPNNDIVDRLQCNIYFDNFFGLFDDKQLIVE